ncbi:MAG: GNAT family N-acetyltransferase [Candidatus Thiodiazotropha taylori]
MPLVHLKPIDKSLLPSLSGEIGKFLLTHRLALMGKPDRAVMEAGITEEVAEHFSKAGISDRYFLRAIIQSGAEELVVGRLWYRLQEEAKGFGGAFLMWIQIDEPYRRKGFATAAVETLMDDLRQQGVTSLGLESYPHNLPAAGLYEKLNLKIVREVRWCRL